MRFQVSRQVTELHCAMEWSNCEANISFDRIRYDCFGSYARAAENNSRHAITRNRAFRDRERGTAPPQKFHQAAEPQPKRKGNFYHEGREDHEVKNIL